MTEKIDPNSVKIRKFYNKIAPVFDDLYADESGGFLKDYEAYEDKLIKQWINRMVLSFSSDEKVKILDLGCGTGYGAEIVKEIADITGYKLSYIGIDIAEGMIKEARSRWDKENFYFEVGDILNSSQYNKDTYGIILSLYASLGHVNDIGKAIQNSYDSLENRGHFFFMTYSRYSFKNLFNSISKLDSNFLKRERDYKIRGFNGEDSCPAYFLTKKELEEEIKDCGFEIISVRGMNTPLASQLSKLKSNRIKSTGFALESKVLSLLPSLGHYLVFHCRKSNEIRGRASKMNRDQDLEGRYSIEGSQHRKFDLS